MTIKSWKGKTILFLALFILALPHFSYRFKHPEKTETQLILDFFKFKGFGELWNNNKEIE